MGCSIAKDSDENTIVVCQYTPKGNVRSNDILKVLKISKIF